MQIFDDVQQKGIIAWLQKVYNMPIILALFHDLDQNEFVMSTYHQIEAVFASASQREQRDNPEKLFREGLLESSREFVALGKVRNLPDERKPWTGERLAELIWNAGISEGVFPLGENRVDLNFDHTLGGKFPANAPWCKEQFQAHTLYVAEEKKRRAEMLAEAKAAARPPAEDSTADRKEETSLRQRGAARTAGKEREKINA